MSLITWIVNEWNLGEGGGQLVPLVPPQMVLIEKKKSVSMDEIENIGWVNNETVQESDMK